MALVQPVERTLMTSEAIMAGGTFSLLAPVFSGAVVVLPSALKWPCTYTGFSDKMVIPVFGVLLFLSLS